MSPKKKAAKEKPAHSKIGASSMYRWEKCPGSVALCETVPNVQSSYAKEGSDAHALAEAILQRELFAKKVKIPEADQEMQDAVHVYTGYVLDHAEKGAEVLVEHRFDLSEALGREGLFGTGDCIAYYAKEKHLHVADYKHGAGVSVTPEKNSQLMYYGLGALLTLGYKPEKITLTVVQPRCPHPDGLIRSWTLTPADLLEFAADLLEAAARTDQLDAPLVPGDHCRFCSAAGVCPAVQKKAQELAVMEFSRVDAYEPEKLAQALQWLPILQGWMTSVREFAYSEAMAGRIPPGWKLVEKRATRHWNDPERAQDVLVDHGFQPDDFLEKPELKSPAKIEKLIKGKLEKFADLGPLVSAVSTGMTLVPESDKRGSAVTDAATDFAET